MFLTPGTSESLCTIWVCRRSHSCNVKFCKKEPDCHRWGESEAAGKTSKGIYLRRVISGSRVWFHGLLGFGSVSR